MEYKVTIGLEVHCELNTEAKNFSRAKNIYSKDPNKYVREVDIALPGIMPYPNKEAVRKALKAALAINCTAPDELIFDRKNYYYPDLPKGYQLTQVTKPVGVNGHLTIKVDDTEKVVEIHQLHLEEDTASLDHYTNYSLINYNRAGIPLIETVTEPCIHSSKEAVKFLEELRRIFLYCGISEAESSKGQMRCDVNVSLQREGDTELGTKVEMKNINSFANVRDCIEYEIKRQSELLDEGRDNEIVMETRRFDDATGKTYPMRKKVDAVDYKYFIEPNIVPTRLNPDYIEEIRNSIPTLPYERVELYTSEYGITEYDAVILVKEKEIADYFEEAVSSKEVDPQKIANVFNTRILSFLNKTGKSLSDITIKPLDLVELIKAMDKGTISSKQGKDIIAKVLAENTTIKDELNKDDNKQITDTSAIESVIDEVFSENPKQVESYDPEHPNIIDYFVGQVMKKTRGKANPALASNMIKEKLDNLSK